MTLIPWTPEPAPFGNATGLDTVSLDVAVAIAIAMDMKVYRGSFPEDIQAEQEAMTPPDRDPRDQRGPLKEITVSHDGLTISGDYSGRRSVRGYRSSYWLDQMTPETVVFDYRSLPWEKAKKLAVRGPLRDVDMPEGMVSTFGPVPSYMAGVADDYMRSVGASLSETGAEIE